MNRAYAVGANIVVLNQLVGPFEEFAVVLLKPKIVIPIIASIGG